MMKPKSGTSAHDKYGGRDKVNRISVGGILNEKGRILGKDRRWKGPMRPV